MSTCCLVACCRWTIYYGLVVSIVEDENVVVLYLRSLSPHTTNAHCAIAICRYQTRIVACGVFSKCTIIFISHVSGRETHLICRQQLIKSQLPPDGPTIIAINLSASNAQATPVARGYSSPPPALGHRRQYPLTPAPTSAPKYPTDTG